MKNTASQAVFKPIEQSSKVTIISACSITGHYFINYVKYDNGILSPCMREYLDII
jgi:hypothetical protein